MASLPLIPLPLPPNGPPPGYGYSDRPISELSTTTAFNTGLEQRDRFLGRNRCVVCGEGRPTLKHCHIIRQAEPEVWDDLQARHYIPLHAKSNQHEPRNGIFLCATHHIYFDEYFFFIRFIPETRKFVLVNHSNSPRLRSYHGKAIALEIQHRHAPFPSLFIIHEMRVRGFHPFAPVNPTLPIVNPWQDWILSEGVFDDASGSFRRERPPGHFNNGVAGVSGQSQQHFPTNADGASGAPLPELNANVIADILAATRAMPSWKACEMEGISWNGTAEENIEKYKSFIGVQDCAEDC